MLTITRYIVVPASQTLHVYYDDAHTGGTNLHAQLTEVETPLDSDAWGNDDLCAALAAHVGVPIDRVRIDPVPPTPDPEPAEAL